MNGAKRHFLFYVLAVFFFLSARPYATETSQSSKRDIPLTVEFALTPEQQTWGLMQRDHLSENHGMLFIYDKSQKLTFWMFNCLIDLSLAFIDENNVITEIVVLKAFPEQMDSERPVLKISDLKKYPFFDPVLLFFYNKRVTSKNHVKFALEMRAGWFYDHDIKVGDRLLWKHNSNKAYIVTLPK